jgi:hypothetical protein
VLLLEPLGFHGRARSQVAVVCRQEETTPADGLTADAQEEAEGKSTAEGGWFSKRGQLVPCGAS